MSAQNFILKKYLRYVYKPRLTADLALEDARQEQEGLIEKFMPEPPHCTTLEHRQYGGVPCQFLKHKRRQAGCLVLYIHGGMFVMGSPSSHQGISAELAQEGAFHVVVPEYSLAPEHPYPAALDELEAVYRDLREDCPSDWPIVLMGDQAGACLAFLLALRLRDKGVSCMPAALVGLSGFFDLTLSGPSFDYNRQKDCAYTRIMFERAVDYYLEGDVTPQTPGVSPLFADLAGLPPVLLQVSDTEMLLDDSVRMAERLKQNGVTTELEIWDDVPSCWQAAAMALPEGRKAVRGIRQFIRKLHHK